MNNYIKEYETYAEKADEEVMAYLIQTLLKLWFQPRESVSDFIKWFEKRIYKYKITWEQLEDYIDWYYDYWDWNEKKIKNFKLSFFSNPIIWRYKIQEYRDKYYNIKDM